MKSSIFFISFLLIFAPIQIEGANILFYFAISTYSHRVAVWPLVEALTARGHSVTFFSSFPPIGQNPNITEFRPKFFTTQNYGPTEEPVLQLRLEGLQSKVWDNLPGFSHMICEMILQDPEVHDWLAKSKFDLVILGAFFNECGLAMAYKMGAKFAIFSPTSHLMWYGDEYGHAPESSWIPELDTQIPHKMGFMDRVSNTLAPLYWQLWNRKVNYLPGVTKMVRKNLDVPDMPDFGELWRHTSLVFVNTHYSFEFARTLPPLYVSVGGLHIKADSADSTALTKEIREFADGAEKDGFIYFSLGSVAKSSSFPPDLLQVFYDVFESFENVRFIWAYDLDRPEGMPQNVLTVKWAPQHAILAHKNIKGFITQGGAMSLQETIYYAVPAIIFPLFGDQDNNAESLQRNGCGIKLEIRGLQRETLKKAILDILTDKTYKSRAMQVSKLFKDRPETPLSTAVWWTEYILRHNDTSALRPLSINQTWYQIRLLDVWFFVFSVPLIAIALLLWVVNTCLSKTRQLRLKLKRS
jgi:glucuronosyltransferase